jgi:hypothetical protein
MLRRKVEERGPDDNYTAVLVRALGGSPDAVIAAPIDDRTEPMMQAQTTQPRSGRGGILAPLAILLSVLALALGGYAAWTATHPAGAAAERAELERLRTTVDSLRLQVEQLNEPFGPVTPGDTLAPAPGTQTP